MIELQRDLPQLETFVTLSPVPGLRRWIERDLASDEPTLSGANRAALAELEHGGRPAPDVAARLAARYLTRAKRSNGAAADPVAHFHLGNGAILHRAHAGADLGAQGLANSWGVMVNYLYDSDLTDKNHLAYTTQAR